MGYSFAVWIDSTEEHARRAQYCDLLGRLVREHSSIGPAKMRVAKFLARQHAQGHRAEIECDSLGESIRDFMQSFPDSDFIFDTTIWLNAWPDLVEPLGVTYYGSSVLSPNREGRRVWDYEPRWEAGDISVDFDNRFLVRPPKHLQGQTADLSRAELDRINDFLISTVATLRPMDATLIQSMDMGRGAMAAAQIVHRQAVEYLRDLARELFLMESDLVGIEEVALADRLGLDRPARTLAYHADTLRTPEVLLVDSRLASLHANCTRALETFKRVDPSLLERRQTCNARILDLAKCGSLLRESIECATEEGLFDAIIEFPDATLDTDYGYWVKHNSWSYKEFPTIYEHLARCVQERRFVK